MFSVYSLADVNLAITNPGVGNFTLGEAGGGRITISRGGDMSSATPTATGYVVLNKLVSKNGTINLEIPTNSDADIYLRKWIKYLKNCSTNDYVATTMTLKDNAANRTLTMSGVVPQKEPDENYDQTAGNRQYVLIFAEMAET